jgi:succinate dehydrogenase flavin-adding protein (antitoxin of CptAB toxin-antitoxin module)
VALPARHERARTCCCCVTCGERHATAPSDERAAFVEFLELPDPDLLRYLIAGDVPTDPRHAALCRAMLQPN